jgi:hypothetical protein
MTDLKEYIQILESRLKDAAAIASRTIKLEHDLGLARAAIAELKHRLFLIASEEQIQQAIANHSVGLFVKGPLPRIEVKRKATTKRRRKK